jgi:hypothetical protein
MSFEIIEGKELLCRYGLAILECNKVEMYMGAILKKNSESTIPDNFGPKISLVEKYIKNKDVISSLNQLNSDRILLAHGFAVKNSDNNIYLVAIKDGKVKNSPKLTEESLLNIYTRAVGISSSLQNLGKLQNIEW